MTQWTVVQRAFGQYNLKTTLSNKPTSTEASVTGSKTIIQFVFCDGICVLTQYKHQRVLPMGSSLLSATERPILEHMGPEHMAEVASKAMMM